MMANRKKMLALLRKGREWFLRPNSTVKDWTNYVEREGGRICRRCIWGGVASRDGASSGWAEEYLNQARDTVTGYRSVTEHHTRREVLRIYNLAIKLAEKDTNAHR